LPRKKTAGELRVANPRGIPEGRHIIRDATGRLWYEGDAYTGPDDPDLIKRGFLVEVDD